MTYAGTDLKYMVTADIEGFDLVADNFSITVMNRWGKVIKTITKGDCLWDEDNNCFFTLDALGRGIYTAVFRAHVTDDDFDDGEATVIDEQVLEKVAVCDCECENDLDCDCKCHITHNVHYERVYTTGGDFLVDCHGNYIVTSEGNYIVFGQLKTKKDFENMGKTRLNMTGEEFKTLIEGTKDNGKIDTLPEVMEALGGINDDTELDVMSHDDVSNMMNQILNRNQR